MEELSITMEQVHTDKAFSTEYKAQIALYENFLSENPIPNFQIQ
jgi:hypothetical protein